MRFDSVLESLSKSGKRVFTILDVAKMIGKSTAYASLMLSKSPRAARIERGKYFLHDATPYEIASNIIFPSYVSLQAGLQYYGLIEQNVVKYSVIALKRHKPVNIGNLKIEFIKTQKRMFFGYLNKSGAYIASVEKLFIDSLYFDNVPFPVLKEALVAAKEEHLIDISLLEKYAIRSESSVLANKLGFLLDQAGIDSEILLKHRYTNYIRIHNAGSKGVNKKWLVFYD